MRPFLALLVLALPAFADEPTDRLAKELVGVVRDPRQDVPQRVEAARTLAKLGPRAGVVVPDLTAQLKRLKGDDLEALQEAVVEALGAIGSAAKPALPTLAVASGRSTDIDLAIKRATKQILDADDSRNVGVLLEQLSGRDVGLRLRAAKALGALKAEATSAVTGLTAALTDPDADVRRAVIGAIRLIQPEAKPSKELILAIAEDLKDADDGLRLLAVRALGKLGPAAKDAAPLIEPLLQDPDKDVKRAATEALQKIGG